MYFGSMFKDPRLINTLQQLQLVYKFQCIWINTNCRSSNDWWTKKDTQKFAKAKILGPDGWTMKFFSGILWYCGEGYFKGGRGI